MEMRKLGGSGISIPPLMFGGNVFGWTAYHCINIGVVSNDFGVVPRYRARRLQEQTVGGADNIGLVNNRDFLPVVLPGELKRRTNDPL